jgi:glycosyltransferase involved in cell wall biosynthesis
MQKAILFIYPQSSSFIRSDLKILNKHFKILDQDFKVSNKILTPFIFIRQLIFLCFNFFKADVVLCQFAGYHSFLPLLFATLFKKPSLLILGGTDTVSFPSISYGNFNKPLLGLFTKWSIQLAKHLLPKHDSLIITDYSFQDNDYPKQGVKYFIPELKTPFTVVYNGYDGNKMFRESDKTPNSFLTVLHGVDYDFQLKLKGVDLIVGVATAFPECTFTIVGVPKEAISEPISDNVKFLPLQPYEKMREIFSKSEFYFQLSIAEGFPNALAESMLCECIPIGSDVFSIPEIISDTGFILKKKDEELLKELVKEALKSDRNVLAQNARERILMNYTIIQREEKLVEVITRLISGA